MIRQLLLIFTLLPALALADYRSVILADNPVGYWRLSGVDCSSSTANEVVGTETVSFGSTNACNQAGALTGDASKAAHGDGLSTSLSQVSNSDLNAGFKVVTTGQLSVEMWVKADATSGSGTDGAVILNHGNCTVGADWAIFINGGAPRVPIIIQYQSGGCSSRAAVGASTAIQTSYYYLVFTLNDGVHQIVYVNGVQEATTTSFTGTQANINTTVGLWGYTGGTLFKGTIDELAIYNHELTQTQITAHYNAGVGIFAGSSMPFTVKLEREQAPLAFALPWRKSALFKPGVSYVSMSPPAFGKAWADAMEEGFAIPIRTHEVTSLRPRPDSPFGRHAAERTDSP